MRKTLTDSLECPSCAAKSYGVKNEKVSPMMKSVGKILIAAAVFISAFIISADYGWIKLIFFMASYIIAGGDILLKAFSNILRGRVFDENFLMSSATIGAFLIGEYPEGVAVMLLYQVGELFQSYAVNKSRKSIKSLMDIRPDYANVKRGESYIKTDPGEVHTGDIINVNPGEKVPLDGFVISGTSMMDTSALTGEPVPREVYPGAEVLSGCININGVIEVEVTKEYSDSTVSRILDLVENASSRKSRSERFITRFARYYTPIVVAVAVLLAVLPPLFIHGEHFRVWIYRALSFLVVSCPCALVISIPLSFFGGIGGASRKGIMVKGGNYLEMLAKTEIIAFDKTGTLTKGVFNVQEVKPAGDFSKEKLLELAAYAEYFSNHPISQSIKKFYSKPVDSSRIKSTEELAGKGVRTVIDNYTVLAGNDKLMQESNVLYDKLPLPGTVVHIAVNGVYSGYILISDEIKQDAVNAIRDLKDLNINKTVMLTGDTMSSAKKVAEELGVEEVYAELLPDKKIEKLEELYNYKSREGKIVFVGDGINDAPSLARADIGIAMGGLGSDAAIEAADVVIMTDEPSKIMSAIKLSKKTLKIAYQNIIFAIGIKVIVLILSAIGITSMWTAIFADVGVTILAVLNAFRALSIK